MSRELAGPSSEPQLTVNGVEEPVFTASRTEAFSDGVFAIALTLLVLDLHTPTRDFGVELVRAWPSYLAYLTAFATISSLWLNHHALFTRVKEVDSITLALNLGLLLGASLAPWPTSLISASARVGHSHADRTAAVVVFTIDMLMVCIPWAILNFRLSRRPHLLHSVAQTSWMRTNLAVILSSSLFAVVITVIAFPAPTVALFILFATPVVSLMINLRTLARRRHRG